MKVSVLLLLLLAAAWTGSQGVSLRSGSRLDCCSKDMFKYQRIPAKKTQGYEETDPSCTLKAVLVKIPKGKVCVDPEEKWFQNYLRKQKKPKSTYT
ncbi:CCL13 protein, partial [Catharus fuscescens]|nr:CCL13 protein [Catharus fuscescens]